MGGLLLTHLQEAGQVVMRRRHMQQRDGQAHLALPLHLAPDAVGNF